MMDEQDKEMMSRMCPGDALRFASVARRLRELAGDGTGDVVSSAVLAARHLDSINETFRVRCEEYVEELRQANGR